MARKLYLIGSGITSATIASQLKSEYEVVVLEKNSFLGGLCATHKCKDINYEFGVHVLYTRNEQQKDFFNKYLINNLQDYYVNLSIDGTMQKNSLYDFPISENNVFRIKQLDNRSPKHEYKLGNNFENYCIKQLGYEAYEYFVKNYNIKQWGIHPADMIDEWAKFRAFNIRKESPNKMFGDLEAGHPGSFNNLFEECFHGCTVDLDTKVNKITTAGNGYVNKIFITTYSKSLGENTKCKIEVNPNDLVINTAPIDEMFDSSQYPLVWRDIIKCFIMLDNNDDLTPSYSTTFPNTYGFTRIIDYNKTSGIKNKNRLLSFAFPCSKWDEFDEKTALADIRSFFDCNGINKDKIISQFFKYENKVYPVSTVDNIKNITGLLNIASNIKNFYTSGRQGLFAYVSMARAYEMGMDVVNAIKGNYDNFQKFAMYQDQRENLW